MKTYLLLRDNRQSGPLTLDDLLRMGLRSDDLVWIEGQSVAWRFPNELEELRPAAPGKIAQPFDRFATSIQNQITSLNQKKNSTPVFSENPEPQPPTEFPTLARFFSEENPAPGISPQQQKPTIGDDPVTPAPEQGAILHAKGISISLPSAARDKTIVVINRKEKPGPDSQANQQELKPELPSSNDTQVSGTERLSPVSSAKEGPLPAIATTFAAAQQPVKEDVQNPKAEQADIRAIPESSFANPPRNKNRGSFKYLQQVAVIVSLLSLVAVTALIVRSVLEDSNNGTSKETGSGPVQTQDPALALPVGGAAPMMNGLNTGDSSLRAGEEKTKENKSKPGNKKPRKTVARAEEGNSAATASGPSAEEVEARRLEAERIEVEKEEARKNMLSKVQIKMEGYKVGVIGGISEFELVVQNHSAYPIDRIDIELTYILTNKKVFKTESIRFSDIPSNSSQQVTIPRSARGQKVKSRIRSIISKELDLNTSN